MGVPDDIKLNIGGTQARAGWSILNIAAGPGVDYIGDCADLSFLGDASCSEVYASHVLEHLSYVGELAAALKHIHRVLKPGGRLRIAVPDLEILCKLFVHPGLKLPDRFNIMRMMFGGQMDPHDFHRSGLTQEFMVDYLRGAGFQTLRRVERFDEFDDMSRMQIGGQSISLNLEVFK